MLRVGGPAAARAPSRHLTVREAGGRRPRFLKIARAPEDRLELAREADAYRLIERRCPATAAAVPRSFGWDPGRARLALEVVAGRDMAQTVVVSGRLDEEDAGRAGAVVASLHEEGEGLDADRPVPARILVVQDWLRPRARDLGRLSIAGVELLGVLQRAGTLPGLLDASVGASRADTLVHGDLRWENVLVEEGDEGSRGIRLVDWEAAGWGEAAWDIACFLAAGIGAWLSTIPHVPGIAPHLLADRAVIRLSAVRPGLIAFWEGYMAARPLTPERASVLSERCVRLVAVRLVELAFESTRGEEYLRAAPVAHLQVALNVLEDPGQAARSLLGIAAR